MTKTSESRPSPDTSLEHALQYFKERQEQFARENHGKVVVIYDSDVFGFFDSELEAYMAATKKYQEGSFLLRQCLLPEEEERAIFHSRVR